MEKKANRIPRFISALIMVGTGGYLVTWSYFRDALGQQFPDWSQTQLSLPFSMHNITVCIMMLVTGSLLAKLSARKVLGSAGAALLIGFGFYAFLPVGDPGKALVLATVGFGVIAALSVGLGLIATFDTFLPWFPDRPGFVAGILTMWCGVAPILLGALCGVFIRQFGVLIAVSLIGVVLAAAIFATLYWAKKPGPDVKLPPAPALAVEESTTDYSPAQMLKTGTYWCLFLFNVTIRSAGLIVSDLGGSIAVALGIATIIGLLFAPANGVACIVCGFLMDRFRLESVLLVVAAFVAAGGGLMVLGNATGATALIVIGIACVGFGYGGVTVTGVTGTRILFGMKYYAKNLGFVSVSIGPAAIAVLLCGKLNMSGSFGATFGLIAALGAAAVLCCIAMYGTEKRRKAGISAESEAGRTAEADEV